MSLYLNNFKKYAELTKKEYSSYLELVDDVKNNMVPFPEETVGNAVIVLGFSGNGKSTWIKSFIEKEKEYVVVSMDEIVSHLSKFIKGFSQTDIIEAFGKVLDHYSSEGKNIIIDGNFLNILTRTALTDTLRELKYNINLVDLTPNIDEVLPIRVRDEFYKSTGIRLSTFNIKDYENTDKYKEIENKIISFKKDEEKRSVINEQINNNLLELGVNNVYSFDSNINIIAGKKKEIT